jgi:hypothetical protein
MAQAVERGAIEPGVLRSGGTLVEYTAGHRPRQPGGGQDRPHDKFDSVSQTKR